MAIDGGKSEVVQALRERGAQDLHSAALLDDAGMVRACVAAGADVGDRDSVCMPRHPTHAASQVHASTSNPSKQPPVELDRDCSLLLACDCAVYASS